MVTRHFIASQFFNLNMIFNRKNLDRISRINPFLAFEDILAGIIFIGLNFYVRLS
jgi:hypothetical protein